MTRTAPAGFEPTPSQHWFARTLLDPNGPNGTYEDIATAVGVDVDKIESWFEDPRFRSWLLYELDTRAAVQVGLIWRSVAQLALTAHDPRMKLEAAKFFLARFDPGLRTGDRDVARGVAEFAKTLAKEAVASAGPRAVHATVVHESPVARP